MRKSNLLCGLMAAVLTLTCAVPALARRGGSLHVGDAMFGDATSAEGMIDKTNKDYAICNSEGDPINTIGKANGFRAAFTRGELTLEGVNPSQTIYVYLGPDSNHENLAESFENEDGESPDFTIRTADLANDNVMNLRVNSSGDGKDLVAGVTQYSSKVVGSMNRGSWIKIMLFDMAETEETKVDINVTFTTKQNSGDGYEGDDFEAGYSSKLHIRLYISNTAVGHESGDGEADNSDRVYYTASSAGSNEFIWGDNYAALKFSADSSPDDFYCRMSNHVDNQVYYDYGDVVNAELWFYDFVTHPVIPSTGRATLTLGIPWDDDDDYKPDPQTCRIYQQDVMGKLIDVTDLFTYDEDAEPIPGWTMRTRSLESYVLSDVPLPVDDKADDYSDIYFYSDEELDRIFAIDPAESMRIQASYIGQEVQKRLLEILKGGVGGSDAPNRVDAITGGVSPEVRDHVDEIVSGGNPADVSGRVADILDGSTSSSSDVADIIAGNE